MHQAICRRSAAACLVLLVSGSVIADELTWAVRAGAGRSDNIARAELGEVDETVGIAGVELVYERVSRGVEIDIRGDVEYRTYVDDTFEDNTWGSANANVQFNLVQNLLSWRFEDRFGHIRPSPFAPETPDNRERINTFATGPEITLPLGSATALGLSGRWSRNTFSETDADNDGLRGLLFLSRALSRNRSLSLNVAANRVEFDDTVLNSSFDTQAAYFGFVSENSRGSVDINLGYNELHDFGEVQDGNYIDITFTRRLTDRTNMDLGYNEQLTYANDLFRGFQRSGNNFGETQRVAGVADPLEIKVATLGFGYERDVATARLSFLVSDEKFIRLNGLDRTTSEGRLRGSRRLGSSWTAGLGVVFRQTEFDVNDRQDDDLIVSFDMGYEFTRTFSVNLAFTRVDRESNIVGANFTENRGFLTFRYGRN